MKIKMNSSLSCTYAYNISEQKIFSISLLHTHTNPRTHKHKHIHVLFYFCFRWCHFAVSVAFFEFSLTDLAYAHLSCFPLSLQPSPCAATYFHSTCTRSRNKRGVFYSFLRLPNKTANSWGVYLFPLEKNHTHLVRNSEMIRCVRTFIVWFVACAFFSTTGCT